MPPTEETMTTLKVTVGQGETLERETIERIRAAEAGADLDDDQPVLNFDSYETLARFLNSRNLELVEVISQEKPGSISEAAELVGRDYRDVHRNVTELANLGLLRLEGGGQGKARTPIVEYDDIEVSIPLESGRNEQPATG